MGFLKYFLMILSVSAARLPPMQQRMGQDPATWSPETTQCDLCHQLVLDNEKYICDQVCAHVLFPLVCETQVYKLLNKTCEELHIC